MTRLGTTELRPPMHKSRRTIRILCFTVFGSAAIVITAGELFSRYALGLGDPPLSIADPDIEYLPKPGSYRRFGNWVSVNAWHMRSPEFPKTKQSADEFRVMVFGDSLINGGGLTDQSHLATELLREQLAEKLSRPVVVGNISAGSWGPGNMLAYARRFGFFDADIVVIVLNSHDIGDNPTGKPIVGVDPSFPSTRSWCALDEALRRYLWPKLLRLVTVPTLDERTSVEHSRDSQAEAQRSLTDLEQLCELSFAGDAAVLLAHFPSRAELSGDTSDGFAEFKHFAADHGISMIDLRDAARNAVLSGHDPYRANDSMHPNALGQRLIADALIGPLLEIGRRPR